MTQKIRIANLDDKPMQYVLTCGLHYLHVTEGNNTEWVTSSDYAHATRFDSISDAEKMLVKLREHGHKGRFELEDCDDTPLAPLAPKDPLWCYICDRLKNDCACAIENDPVHECNDCGALIESYKELCTKCQIEEEDRKQRDY